MAVYSVCKIDGCDKRPYARGFCNRHYQRWLRHGDPLGGKTVSAPLRYFREVVMTHTGDECLDWPFSRDSKGYAKVRFNSQYRIVSRLACMEAHGEPPTPEHHAAHSCGRGKEGCVNPHHMRWATPKENEADKLIHGRSDYRRGNRSSKHRDESGRWIPAPT